MKDIILRIQTVSRRFTGQSTPAVEGLNLELRSGELISLLGPSGCGKTTLLRLIAGFEQPQMGDIYLGDQQVSSPRIHVPPEQRQVGMVFQDYALFPHLTVAQNIAFGLEVTRSLGHGSKFGLVSLGQRCKAITQTVLTRLTNWGGTPHRDRVQEMLRLVGLAGLDHRYPHQLSGGQQQRVALARALAPQPHLILLDEPLSNLDVQVRSYLRQELRQILKKAGTTAILVTHDQEEALSISDRVAVMHQGRLEQVASPHTLYENPATPFVAEFVTQANVLPAQRQGQGWLTELGWFEDAPLTGSKAGATIAQVMIRQEDILLTPHPEGLALVKDQEFLGREQRYRLELPSGRSLLVRQPLGNSYPPGSRVAVAVPSQRWRVFSQNDQDDELAVPLDEQPYPNTVALVTAARFG